MNEISDETILRELYSSNRQEFTQENFYTIVDNPIFVDYLLHGTPGPTFNGYKKLILCLDKLVIPRRDMSPICSLLTVKQRQIFFAKLSNETKRNLLDVHFGLMRTKHFLLSELLLSLYYLVQIFPSDITNDKLANYGKRILKKITKHHYWNKSWVITTINTVDIPRNPTNITFGNVNVDLAQVICRNPNLSTYFTITDKVKMEVELML